MQNIRNKKSQKSPSSLPMRKMMRGKIHRATVTQANLNYEGSITIDKTLMEAMDLYEFESVHIWDVNNGERFETYTIRGERGSGVICLNGAAARLVQKNDLVIVVTYCQMAAEEARNYAPTVVLLDEGNLIKKAA